MTQVEQLTVVRCQTEDQWAAVQQLRHAVLDPAKIRPTELDVSAKDRDPRNIVMGTYIGEILTSTVRLDLIPASQWYVVRKMATHEDWRRQGHGREALLAGEAVAIENGGAGFVLDSRRGAIPFYESMGYHRTGRQVEHNDGIPNFTMLKVVKRDATHG